MGATVQVANNPTISETTRPRRVMHAIVGYSLFVRVVNTI